MNSLAAFVRNIETLDLRNAAAGQITFDSALLGQLTDSRTELTLQLDNGDQLILAGNVAQTASGTAANGSSWVDYAVVDANNQAGTLHVTWG